MFTKRDVTLNDKIRNECTIAIVNNKSQGRLRYADDQLAQCKEEVPCHNNNILKGEAVDP